MMDEESVKSISYKTKSYEGIKFIPALATNRTVRIDFTGTIVDTTSRESFRWLPPDKLDPTSLDDIVSKLPPVDLPHVDSPESSTEIEGQNSRGIGLSDTFDASGLIAQSESSRFENSQSRNGKFDSDMLAAEQQLDAILNPAPEAVQYEGLRSKSVSFGTDEVIPDSKFLQKLEEEGIDIERGRKPRSLRSTNKSYCTRWKCFCASLLLLVPVAAGLVIYFLLVAGDDSTSGPSGADNETPTPSLTTPTLPPATSPSANAPSQPIVPPSIPETDVLLQLLSRYSTDDGASLRDPASPQFAAMQWIRTPNNAGIYSDHRFLTRYALASLYFSTSGGDWTTSTGWLSPAHECDWYSGRPNSPSCDEAGNIIEIDLTENNLQGTLPPELTLLSLSKLFTLGYTQDQAWAMSPFFLTPTFFINSFCTAQYSENGACREWNCRFHSNLVWEF